MESCVQYCKYAKDCVGEALYKKLKRKRVAFVGVDNAARSVMAEALAKEINTSPRLGFISAGVRPSEAADPGAVEFLEAENIAWRGRPKGLARIGAVDLFVLMGPEVELPGELEKVETIRWDIPDPRGKGPGEYRRVVEPAPENTGSAGQAGAGGNFSALGHWPVKLHLIPPSADFLKNSDLILAADCVPFAYGDFHRDFLSGRTVAAGCPKFDDVDAYREKIEQMLESVNIRSITVVYMEISCCGGFVRLVREALESSGSGIPLETVRIGVKGEVIKREVMD